MNLTLARLLALVPLFITSIAGAPAEASHKDDGQGHGLLGTGIGAKEGLLGTGLLGEKLLGGERRDERHGKGLLGTGIGAPVGLLGTKLLGESLLSGTPGGVVRRGEGLM